MIKVQSTYYPSEQLTFNEWIQHIWKQLNQR
jgi:hypothetical protein